LIVETRLRLSAVGFIASLLVLGGCGEDNTFVPPPPPKVTVAQPLTQEVTDFLEFTGTTEATETSFNSSLAFHTLISPDFTTRSTTVSKSSGGVPAADTTLRAWRVMWPCWMPSVARARRAAKF